MFLTLSILFSYTINRPLPCNDINLNETVQIILQLIMMSTVRFVTSSNPTHKLQSLKLLHILVIFSWTHKRPVYNYITRRKKRRKGSYKHINHTHTQIRNSKHSCLCTKRTPPGPWPNINLQVGTSHKGCEVRNSLKPASIHRWRSSLAK
jgi:hypothetical protein